MSTVAQGNVIAVMGDFKDPNKVTAAAKGIH